MADVIKYVRIEGRMQIEFQKGTPDSPTGPITGEPNEEVLVMRFLDENFEVRPGLEPLYFYLNDQNGNPDPVKFRYVHLIAAFNQTGFRRVEHTLRTVDPLLEPWEEMEALTIPDKDMNPSGPPKPKM
ncbi:MAG: hypothetical protein J7619_13040 [Dyadobacter sp.]|uniref:hypothetical protein n=1 Tax=Dyadobacter sp. TaxID=1914288 RepID=UPI001B1A46B9|nr:hypothetical protein [Dyadobacter sp.]MBO9613620.1 hypothetical protein [Dyadobacter sp.]